MTENVPDDSLLAMVAAVAEGKKGRQLRRGIQEHLTATLAAVDAAEHPATPDLVWGDVLELLQAIDAGSSAEVITALRRIQERPYGAEGALTQMGKLLIDMLNIASGDRWREVLTTAKTAADVDDAIG